jgi:small subunit ribosomal protein S1
MEGLFQINMPDKEVILMVDESSQNLPGGPPPMDESWWAALLMEEENLAHPRPAMKAKSPSAAPEPKTRPGPRASAAAEPRRAPQPPEERRQRQPRAQREPRLQGVNWDHAIAIFTSDEAVSLRVTGYNRGGLLVEGGGLRGFVPLSHLLDLEGDLSNEAREDAFDDYVGRLIRLKVIECEPERGRLVFSERAAQAESGRRTQLLGALQPGVCVWGNVTNITDFGAFVDLGGVEGLIHVSELSWGRVRHPADMLSLGQRVQVYVISVDEERGRIALSLKRLCLNPWETAEDRYTPGQIVDAVVTAVLSFGAFARIEEGLDGLIHISEMNQLDEAASRPLEEGASVRVRILQVESSRQRMALSLRLEP